MSDDPSTNPWERFDRAAEAMAKKEVKFEKFLAITRPDFGRLARKVARMKRLPAWVSLEDVEHQLVVAAWHNFFVRAGGFDPSKYRSAGAWIRWKAKNRVLKDLSKARGEYQHTRRGPAAPEYLSKTGELPDVADRENVELLAERSIEIKKLEKICETSREFAVVQALAQGMGDDRRVVAFLLKQDQGFTDASEALRAVDDLVSKVEKRQSKKARAKKVTSST